MTVTSTSVRRSALAANKPPNPAPTIATRCRRTACSPAPARTAADAWLLIVAASTSRCQVSGISLDEAGHVDDPPHGVLSATVRGRLELPLVALGRPVNAPLADLEGLIADFICGD